MTTSRSAAALLFALCACQAEPEPRTEILLVVDSDLRVPDQLDRLEVRVEGPGELVQSAAAQLDDTNNPLPRSVALVHRGGPLGPLHATVQGKSGDQVVIAREARLSFLAGRTLVLPMHLAASCLGFDCGEQTCTERGCESIDVDPTTLAPYAGDEPGLPRADGGGREFDAGARDAAALDAGESADGDAGSDVSPAPEGGLASEAGGQDAGTQDGGGEAEAADAGPGDAGACMPALEQCNGRDDDCDGLVDDGFDLQNDPDHCGTCDIRCTGLTRRCCAGECRSSCR